MGNAQLVIEFWYDDLVDFTSILQKKNEHRHNELCCCTARRVSFFFIIIIHARAVEKY